MIQMAKLLNINNSNSATPQGRIEHVEGSEQIILLLPEVIRDTRHCVIGHRTAMSKQSVQGRRAVNHLRFREDADEAPASNNVPARGAH